MKDFISSHSQIERILHDLAFKPWYPRVALSNIESRIYKRQLADVSVEKPVFITALPRAGTTLLLELCVGNNEFASHTYSDMPFLMTPLLWNRFSRNFQKSGTLNERVHGDGILVNVNSPESFEEIIWKEFWPSRYKEERIIPWTESSYSDFEDFFLDNMRKIIFLRRKEEKQVRFISKNNLNIARIGYLGGAFPDSTILILFRSPLQHASSLLKQHRNFLRIHKEDSYAKKYMEDTGHFDFGQNLRPVDFDGWLSKEHISDPNTLSFWLRYWISAYRYLLNGANDRVRFFSYDSLCDDPQSGLERLGGILEVKNIGLLMSNVDRITAPKPHAVDVDDIAPNIIDQAEDLYLELQNAESP
ncbi:MAG: sulfotransferase [Bacteroidota bacterium]